MVLFFLPVPASAETQVCFKYYHGLTGALRATTPSVTITSGCAAVSVAVHPSVCVSIRPSVCVSVRPSVRVCVCVCVRARVFIRKC